LPKLLAGHRTHSSNSPIPDKLQPVLMLYPLSPWRDAEGNRRPYDGQAALDFDEMLDGHGIPGDLALRREVRRLIAARGSPDDFVSPISRRGRAQLRVVLRRMAQEIKVVEHWRMRFDRTTVEVPSCDGESGSRSRHNDVPAGATAATMVSEMAATVGDAPRAS
jgi:hypothetical protein